MSQPRNYFALILVLGICVILPNVNARFRRVFPEDQSQDISQTPQRPQVQTKPFRVDLNDETQFPQLQTKPLYYEQVPQRPVVQPKPWPRPAQNQNQQRPGQKPDLSQNQNQNQQKPNGDDWADEDENELQQSVIPQNGKFDKDRQTQVVQDIDKYAQELDKQAALNGHKGQVTKDDVEQVEKKNQNKPWYVRLKNWGSKKISEIF